MVHEIISYVRRVICAQKKYLIKESQWNEEEGGAGWLDNEISLATDILTKLTSIPYSWSDLHSVKEFETKLDTLPEPVLQFIKYVVVDLEGSSHSLVFHMRDKMPVEDIREFFAKRNFTF